ncbi:glucosaminidase domain-containing protein [Photobacterium sp.]|uniref:glucosaminidase domain-containing protein n=1 Tax=Photobacterium sp. TaxID=660 RepID=UPI00299E5849|nr:glucosaminidase domain-containing protein [Photobacterium sp.]MDX1301781.1 glucosaminidase domain-containing protein [Photobacterium sp.]
MILKNKIALVFLISALTACGEAPFGNISDSSKDKETSSEPDFAVIEDVNQKKQSFFDHLRPAVVQENKRVSEERDFLLKLKSKAESEKAIDSKQLVYATKLGNMYQLPLNSDSVTNDWLSLMLLRVDVLPEELVLSQAANESAWGTSRFAVDGNNYFGQWCYREGCGLVPASRTEGFTHEVAVFDSAYQSVNAYFMNLNRNNAYTELRQIRAEQRTAGQTITGTKLAEGLSRYSERGHEYIDEIQSMIRHNNKYWSQG